LSEVVPRLGGQVMPLEQPLGALARAHFAEFFEGSVGVLNCGVDIFSAVIGAACPCLVGAGVCK
jgi:hypothetical protein